MVSGDTESGPIPVTVKVAGACKVGWDVVGVLALSNKGSTTPALKGGAWRRANPTQALD